MRLHFDEPPSLYLFARQGVQVTSSSGLYGTPVYIGSVLTAQLVSQYVSVPRLVLPFGHGTHRVVLPSRSSIRSLTAHRACPSTIVAESTKASRAPAIDEARMVGRKCKGCV